MKEWQLIVLILSAFVIAGSAFISVMILGTSTRVGPDYKCTLPYGEVCDQWTRRDLTNDKNDLLLENTK